MRTGNKKANALKSLFVAAGLFGALLFASTSPADARMTHVHPGRPSHGLSHGRAVARGPVARPFAAPRHIAFRTVRTFDPFFSRHVFYGPHRHFHSVYSFPVATSYGVVYQPYSYCGDDLYDGYGYGPVVYGHVGYRGPRFGFSIGF